MKKRGYSLIILAAICMLLSSCNTAETDDLVVEERHVESIEEDTDKPKDREASDIPQDTEETEESEESEETEETDTSDTEEISSDVSLFQTLKEYSQEELSRADSINSGRYAYETLNDSDKILYNKMLLGVNEMTEGVDVDIRSEETYSRIFQCVMMDHPEIFWVTGFTHTRYTMGDEVKAVGFKGLYCVDEAVRQSRQASIEQYAANVLAGLPDGDDYSKIKYIYEYIILHTEYDVNADDNQNICSVFLNGRSVCQGYAKATQFLLNRAGVMCTLVTGTTCSPSGRQNHTWNLVKSDGNYYYLDTTWGDASFQIADGYTGSIPTISYDYLCVPFEQINRTHELGAPVAMPACTAIQDNYYVREGAYFTGVDEAGVKALFDRAYANGQTSVVIKASDANVYAAIKKYLLDDQKVFNYLSPGAGTVSYWENSDSYWISFSL